MWRGRDQVEMIVKAMAEGQRGGGCQAEILIFRIFKIFRVFRIFRIMWLEGKGSGGNDCECSCRRATGGRMPG